MEKPVVLLSSFRRFTPPCLSSICRFTRKPLSSIRRFTPTDLSSFRRFMCFTPYSIQSGCCLWNFVKKNLQNLFSRTLGLSGKRLSTVSSKTQKEWWEETKQNNAGEEPYANNVIALLIVLLCSYIDTK